MLKGRKEAYLYVANGTVEIVCVYTLCFISELFNI